MTAKHDTSSNSSPATLALANATNSASLTKMKPAFAATDCLSAMLAVNQENAFPAVDEEEAFGFPSIEWLGDDEDDSFPSGDPLEALSSALKLIKEDNFRRSFKTRKTATTTDSMPNKRRRTGDHGMVRSKAMQNSLSSLVAASSGCSKESAQAVMPAQFVLGDWGSMLSAREVTSDFATCSIKTTAGSRPFERNGGLLTV